MATQAKQQDHVWHIEAVEDVEKTLQTDITTGLSSEEVEKRLKQFGLNELEERGGKNPFLILWEQFTSTMVLILIAAAVVSGFLGKPLETIAITAIVVLFAVLGFIQEYRAERAVAALKQFAVPTVRTKRNGNVEQSSAKKIVAGDIIILEAGGVVPADLRIIESNNLLVQEATLTGESEPLEKDTHALEIPNLPLGDRVNMAYMGTTVSYGRGVGIVVATGMQTQLGRIATLIQDVEQQETPLQRQLAQVGTLLAVTGVFIAIIVMIIGLARGEPANDMFLTAVSVAVAIVPEGLPAVVTLTLALGAQRMLRRHALIRKLPAVETLGSVTIICSDKTGTLTENRMTVTVLDIAGHFVELSGTGKHPAPNLVADGDQQNILTNQPPPLALLLVSGALCNDASLAPDPKTGKFLPTGDPTEGALLVAATQAGLTQHDLEDQLPRVAEVPFDSVRKRMTTIHRLPETPSDSTIGLSILSSLGSSHVAISKGSVDGLVEVASQIWVTDHAKPLTEEWRTRIQIAHDRLALNGMRVLGVTIKPIDTIPTKLTANIEEGLTFIGLVGMIDPPRPEVSQAIHTCKKAGIRPIMITGDHPLTARFIAHELGITENERVKTGQDLDRLSAEELSTIVDEVSVYARVTPEHKLRIVEALQQKSNVVAMTGDGVNDSPALKKADIGVAMGITGTDVSKEAAQMVLLDDNFATIVAAVEEGRTIFNNLRRFVKFSIAGNMAKVLVMLFAPFVGISVALLPLQLLWLNLLTDGLLGLGLGMEPADQYVMTQPPRKKDDKFLSADVRRYILVVGLFIGLTALVIGIAYYQSDSPDDLTWQTMIFTTLAFMQLGQALASRSDDASLFALGWRSNPVLLVMAGIVFLSQLAVIYVPFLESFFEIEALNLVQLSICIGAGILAFIGIESLKSLRAKSQENTLTL